MVRSFCSPPPSQCIEWAFILYEGSGIPHPRNQVSFFLKLRFASHQGNAAFFWPTPLWGKCEKKTFSPQRLWCYFWGDPPPPPPNLHAEAHCGWSYLLSHNVVTCGERHMQTVPHTGGGAGGKGSPWSKRNPFGVGAWSNMSSGLGSTGHDAWQVPTLGVQHAVSILRILRTEQLSMKFN